MIAHLAAGLYPIKNMLILDLRIGHEISALKIRYSSLWKREGRRDFCGEDIIMKSPLPPLCQRVEFSENLEIFQSA
jgi:hypothetical protein